MNNRLYIQIIGKEVRHMANNGNGGGSSFWGTVGAIIVAVLILSVL